MPNKRYLLALPFLLTLVIIISSSLPGGWLPHWVSYKIDKSLHSLAYGLLACCWLIALRPLISSISGQALITIIICLVSGLGLEWLQNLIPHRRPDILDLQADMIGVLVVTGCWWLVMQIQYFRKSRQ